MKDNNFSDPRLTKDDRIFSDPRFIKANKAVEDAWANLKRVEEACGFVSAPRYYDYPRPARVKRASQKWFEALNNRTGLVQLIEAEIIAAAIRSCGLRLDLPLLRDRLDLIERLQLL